MPDLNGNTTNERQQAPNEDDEVTLPHTFLIYMAWAILLAFGYLQDWMQRLGLVEDRGPKEHPRHKDFPSLYTDFDRVYMRNMYTRVRDIFERPICSVPGATVDIIERTSDDGNWNYKLHDKTSVINVGSYNYLGFAQSEGPCAERSREAIEEHGLALASTVNELGATKLQHDLEKLVADFLGVECAICFSMGYATNTMNLPCLIDENSLIISDKLNHTSLIIGSRISRATIKVFNHNDVQQLERLLIEAVTQGNKKTKKPYSKILIIVEGIYSMEGTICELPAIIELKKKYKAYLYLDEAHSIGAMGRTGRGIVEYWECKPDDVDVLMGTFTKSFGSAGGYIAGRKSMIDHIRKHSAAGCYSSPMSPPIVQQIIESMSIIMGRKGSDDGRIRIERLARNTRYFRQKLKQLGMMVYGSDDSPVVPMLIFTPATTGFYGREMLRRGVAAVGVSYPATEMTTARMRFCISAAHTKEMLDEVLAAISEVADLSATRMSPKNRARYEGKVIEW